MSAISMLERAGAVARAVPSGVTPAIGR